jgi:hypothetical protein
MQISTASAQTVSLDAKTLLPHVEVFPLPTTGGFLEGSTFDVPIFINTEGNSINAIDLTLKYDPSKMKIVNPSGGKSIVGLWLEAPYFNNTTGQARFVGGVPGGIKTSSGLIVTISFKALVPGNATLTIDDGSSVLLNDGSASRTIVDTKRGTYSILARPAEGLAITSDTHPVESDWYNNRNVTFAWETPEGASGFGFTLDKEPKSTPGTTITSASTSVEYDNLADGVWYFHLKAQRKGVWGPVSHRAARIDTEPPAIFTPVVERVVENDTQHTQIAFETTDALSGIDHYEVGVVDMTAPSAQSPVYIESESPYVVPENIQNASRVYVRAMDKAGNVRDVFIDVPPFKVYTYFYEKYALQILLSVIALLLAIIGGHFLLTHHYLRRMKKALLVLETDEPEAAPLESPTVSATIPKEESSY